MKTLDETVAGCLVCAGPGQPFRTFGSYALLRCSSCGSLYYVPPPEQETIEGDRPWESPKWYVERGANLLFYAEVASLVQRLLEARRRDTSPSSRRVLEIGGSYGFLVDIGRETFGWEVAAADPSTCARRGSADLGIPLQNVKVEDARFETSFDAVIGVQLIEHLHDPFAFSGVLAGLLSDSGFVFLTTPDAAFEDLGPDYHPGEHVVLFSRQGLTDVLRSAGLEHSIVFKLSLPQMFAVAAARTFLKGGEESAAGPSPESLAETVEGYIRKKLEAEDLPDSLRGGLQFRLFELLVNAGRYDEAVEHGDPLETLMGRGPAESSETFLARTAAAMTKADDNDSYEQAAPGFAAPYLLYQGIMELNHRGRRQKAAVCFTLARRLFEHEVNRFGLTQYAPFLAAARSSLRIAEGRLT